MGLVGFAFNEKRAKSVLGLPMQMPARTGVNARLVSGAVVFGIGWGLVGLCPGPALVALTTGAFPAIAFVLAMLAGMALYELTLRPSAGAPAGAAPTSARTRA